MFLDRDGVVIANRSDYVKSWDEVAFLPGAFQALRQLVATEYAVVVVTNQSAVGRGLITLEEAHEINRRVLEEITSRGGRVDAVYLCPHRPADECDCRKPKPGMLLSAAADLDLDLCHSFMIGDALSDVQAAWQAGVRPIMVLTGLGTEEAQLLRIMLGLRDHRYCVVVSDLAQAIDCILEWESSDPRLETTASRSKRGGGR